MSLLEFIVVNASDMLCVFSLVSNTLQTDATCSAMHVGGLSTVVFKNSPLCSLNICNDCG